MNEDKLKEFKCYLREKYGKKNTVVTYFEGISKFAEYIHPKSLIEATKEDLISWKQQLQNTKKQNTIRAYCYSVNRFYQWKEITKPKLTIPQVQRANRVVFSEEEKERFLESAKEKPIENLVALLLYDAILRPEELINIQISNIDFENHCIHLDKTKVNKNMPALISSRVEKAVREYLTTRPKPLDQEDKDYLLINPHSRGHLQRYKTTWPIRRIIKTIAIRTGINKNVTPYKTIKPSALTLRFNDHVNPRTLQRLARHKDIKTTLIYDHSTDKDALEYLEKQVHDIDYTLLSTKEQAQVLMDKFFKGEIDKVTFDTMLELLRPEHQAGGEITGYS